MPPPSTRTDGTKPAGLPSIQTSLARERRGSLTSISSRRLPDSAAQSSTLNHIHTNASQSDALTTFAEYAPPPRSSATSETKSLAGELVQSGISGLYNRLRASVGSSREGELAYSPGVARSIDSGDDGSVRSLKLKAGHRSMNSASTLDLPSAVPASPTSLLRSSASAKYSDPQTTAGKPLASSSVSIASKASLADRASLASTQLQSRPTSSTTYSQTEPIPTPHVDEAASGTSKDVGAQITRSVSSTDSNNATQEYDEAEVVEDQPHEALDINPSTLPVAGSDDDDRPSLHVTTELHRAAHPDTHGSETSSMAKDAKVSTGADSQITESRRPANQQRPPLVQISQSHLPGYRPSRATSSDGDLSSITTVAASRHANPVTPQEAGKLRLELQKAAEHNGTQMSSRLLAREFWMRDENAKDCFYCGDTFSTFRRKHHCRTCGQIFDAKCTSILPGKVFGVTNTVRVCKPCEHIINGTDDDSSVVSEESEDGSLQDPQQHSLADAFRPQNMDEVGMPTIGIPVSRKSGSETKRRSAILEFDEQPALARPSSSRSLRSLSGRPMSAKPHTPHRKSRSKLNQAMRVGDKERAPFQGSDVDEAGKDPQLPAFHHDNIIDPDIADFLSDEGSSEEETMSLFATLDGEDAPQSPLRDDRSGFNPLFSSSLRKSKSRGDRSYAATSHVSRDIDTASISSRHARHHSRKRNISGTSLSQPRQSPRRSKSNSILRNFPLPFGSSLGTSLEVDPPVGRPGLSHTKMTRSASMRGEAAPPIELNQASLQHVRKMLKQMLQDGPIGNVRSWEKALMPILLKCTNEVDPDIRRRDFIDIRHYVKLKKIPGGKPGDTTYVSGVVFTKNVALKSMARNIPNPRILIVTFPIEYARHNQHFMSLEPVIAQEKEYLRNIVRRIIAFDPQVLLVQRHVAGFALDLLNEAGISVVFNVKASVLNAVARCTQARLIQTVDKLVFDPLHVGHCGSFDVKTYLSQNIKKTYVRLSGCKPDLGCTIALRGADKQTLRKLKRITEFMCYVMYNLRLETSLMREEYVMIPAATSEGTISPSKGLHPPRRGESGSSRAPSGGAEVPDPQDPNAIIRAFESSDQPLSEKISAEMATDADLESRQQDHQPQPAQGTTKDSGSLPSFYDDVVEKHKTKILSTSPFVKFMPPYLLMQARQLESRLGDLKRTRDQYRHDNENVSASGKFQLVKPEMVQAIVQNPTKQVKEFLFAVHDAEYDNAMHTYTTQKRQWESYLSSTINLFDPLSHQRIAFLYSMVLTQNTMPCIGPETIALEFYNEQEIEDGFATDITLGQYVEDLIHGAGTVCGVNGCDKSLFNHHRQYVHGLGQMTVFVQKHPPKIPGLTKRILMWSQCRICQVETPPIGMSDTTWKYSFGKYLELMFWSSDLRPRAVACEHDIHRDHVRYFGLHGAAVRIQFDAIDLHEVLIPRSTITWKVNSDLKLKNEQYQRIKERLDKFMHSVKNRIKAINSSTVLPEKLHESQVELERLTKRANEDHETLTKKLQDKYMMSRYYEIIPMNRAIRFMHEKAIDWDEAFAEFERDFFPSEKDISRLAQAQLKKIFMDKDESSTTLGSTEEEQEPNSDLELELKRNGPDLVHLEPSPSHLSPEQSQQILEASLEKVHSSEETGVVGDIKLPHPSLPTESNQESGQSQGSNLSREGAEQIAESHEVKHLDLAVAADHPEPQKSTQTQKGNTAPDQLTSEGNKLPLPGDVLTTASTAPNPSSSGRDSPSTTREGVPESKIPRRVDQTRREGLLPPPLSRAHSQPADVLRRQQRGANATNVAAGGKSDLKTNLTEAARAFEKRFSERLGKTGRTVSQSLIPRSVAGRGLHVSRLAKHFEQLTREFEQERLRERRLRTANTKQARAYPLASSKATVEVYPDVHQAVQDKSSPHDDSRADSPSRKSTDPNTQLTGGDGTTKLSEEGLPQEHLKEQEAESSKAGDTHETASDAGSSGSETQVDDTFDEGYVLSPSESQLDMSIELPKHEKLSLIKMLRTFWSERSASGWIPLEYPLMPNEHVWDNSDVIVREDEPSSIIALALSDGDYLSKLQRFREQRTPAPETKRHSNCDHVEHFDHLSREDDQSIEKNLLRSERTHINYSFQHRGVRARCKIFYAESFDALRRKSGVADRIVESLSRCLKYDAKGGKTKSLFLKTLDDRFVLKSLSPPEYNAFFKFAPNYFSFTHQIMFKGLPSVIAKMLGLFQVTIKNTITGFEFDWYMLVMENLFYHQEPDRRFDLKGSMRNRKIQVTGERDEVLQDENLVDIIFEKPIFVREHTMTLLKACVWNDTLFLSQQNVMDYSLMAGFLDTRKEIVVGIIDCIRTYTWDKKLETWIKDRGKNKPTITSPKDYKNRFRIAMSKYILLAPNCWHHFSTQIQKRPLRLDVDQSQADEGDVHIPVGLSNATAPLQRLAK